MSIWRLERLLYRAQTGTILCKLLLPAAFLIVSNLVQLKLVYIGASALSELMIK